MTDEEIAAAKAEGKWPYMIKKPAEKPKRKTTAYIPTIRDRQIVEMLAGVAIPYLKIAHVLKIAELTLRRHFVAELERAAAVVEATLVNNMLQMAKKQDAIGLKATMFMLQCRFGWSQYVPAQALERELGKKEILQIEAETGHVNSDWSELIH
jgi:hypothetical protein